MCDRVCDPVGHGDEALGPHQPVPQEAPHLPHATPRTSDVMAPTSAGHSGALLPPQQFWRTTVSQKPEKLRQHPSSQDMASLEGCEGCAGVGIARRAPKVAPVRDITRCRLMSRPKVDLSSWLSRPLDGTWLNPDPHTLRFCLSIRSTPASGTRP